MVSINNQCNKYINNNTNNNSNEFHNSNNDYNDNDSGVWELASRPKPSEVSRGMLISQLIIIIMIMALINYINKHIIVE